MECRKSVSIEPPRNLYRWAKLWNRKQREFFVEQVVLRREKQIIDFILLNGFEKVRFKTDTDVFVNHPRVDQSEFADLVVITDQKFSRFPCGIMPQKIQAEIEKCPNLYLCLNRHYINIDDTHCDPDLGQNFNLAITRWLKKSLPDLRIIDLSLDYLDRGDWFTWAIPDRHYFITHA